MLSENHRGSACCRDFSWCLGVLRGKQLRLPSTGCFVGDVLDLRRARGHPPTPLTPRPTLQTAGSQLSFAETSAGPLTFTFGLIIFSFSLTQRFTGTTSYKVMSVSTSCVPSTHAYDPPEWPGAHQQNRGGWEQLAGSGGPGGPQITGLLRKAEFSSSVMGGGDPARRSSRGGRIHLPPPSERSAPVLSVGVESCLQITALWVLCDKC